MDEATQAGGAPGTAAAEHATKGLEQLTNVSAERVFREPVFVGDRAIITAASIEIAGGLGFGGGGGTDPSGTGSGAGSGGGMGARTEGRPVAVIEVGPDGVRVRPILDMTRIGITFVLSALAVWRALRK